MDLLVSTTLARCQSMSMSSWLMSQAMKGGHIFAGSVGSLAHFGCVPSLASACAGSPGSGIRRLRWLPRFYCLRRLCNACRLRWLRRLHSNCQLRWLRRLDWLRRLYKLRCLCRLRS